MRKLFSSALLGGIFILLSGNLAMAAEGAAAGGYSSMAIAITAGLTIGLVATAGAFAQSRAIVAALRGIARNPGAAGKLFTPMILGLALIESLVIYAWIISIMLVLKV